MELMPLLVKGNAAQIKTAAIKSGGKFNYNIGSICSVEIPYRELVAFSDLPFIERIENTFAKGMSFADTARIRNNINEVHNGNAPLPKAFTGKNVVVGIIDGSMFFNHGDFKNPDGTTRIKYMWDQVSGLSWDSADINSGNCNYIPPLSDQGHGTTVAGIAAGNGLSWSSDSTLMKKYKGVAPDANIVVVNVDYNSSNFLQSVADAVSYIFLKADDLGMPCVVNTSLGTYYGSHDGKDLNAQAIESLIAAKKGRSLVAAGGNAGNANFHLSYSLSATDSLFTWFKYNNFTSNVYFDLWADTAQFKLANFALGCDNNAATFLGRSKYYNVPLDFNPPQGSGVLFNDSIFNGATKLCNYGVYAELVGASYHIEFLVKPVNTTHLWRLQTKGSGNFNLWAHSAFIGSADILTILPSGFSSPNYRFPDNQQTIVSSWQCSDKVITVANYYNQAAYLDMDSVYQSAIGSGEFVGNIAANSSLGPTRDGRQKPDISATGSTIIATGDSFDIASLLLSPGNRLKVGYGGKHMRNGGTSMASPVVAGAVALYLEKRPFADYNEIKQVVATTAKTDIYTTTTVPNISWGYGKLNAFQALTVPLYGCKDPLSLNYNPLATVDTGGCAYSNVWNGNISSDWNNPLNWTPDTGCCGPNSCSSNVVIPSGTPYLPRISIPNVTSGNVRIADNVQVTIDSNCRWHICKDISGGNVAKSIISGGLLLLDGTVNQKVAGKLRIDSLQLYNNSNTTITGNLEINSRLMLKLGIMNSNFGTLKFLSTSPVHCATIDFTAGNAGSIVGDVIAERWVPLSGGNIHLISSPVLNPDVAQISATGIPGFVSHTANCDETQSVLGSPKGTLFSYDESQASGCALGGWESITTDSFNVFKGYAAYLNGNQSFSLTGFANQGYNYSLTGVSNSAWSTHNSLQGRPYSSGWNLVGNPYLSYLQLQTKSGFDAQAQIWQTTGTYAGTFQPVMMSEDAVFPPFQAFWVKKHSPGSGTFSVSRSECVSNPAILTPFYKLGNDYEMHITLSGNGFADKTKIYYSQGATDVFDSLYDANKFHSKLGQPSLYTLSGNQHMAINTLLTKTLNDSVSLGFEPGTSGNYKLTFDQLNTFPVLTKIYLEDRKTAAPWINLKVNPVYSFTASTSDTWDRFVIHFSTPTGINEAKETTSYFDIYPNPFKDYSIFRINLRTNEELSIKILDNLGRLSDVIELKKGISEFRYENRLLNSGVYMVSLEENGRKIAIKKLCVEK